MCTTPPLTHTLSLHDALPIYDLVRRVVESILPSLTVQEHQSLQKDRPASPTVYQIYLQANEFGRQWENLSTAIEMYERCVSLEDRKSTRLNSSHITISYAVFC